MHEENEDEGLDLDTGQHVEEARGYDPEDDDKGIVDSVKDALGVGNDDSDDDDVDDVDGTDDVDDDDELIEDDKGLI